MSSCIKPAALPAALSLALLAACATPSSQNTESSPTPATSSTEVQTAPAPAILSEPGSEAPAAATAVLNTATTIDGRVMPVMRGQQIVATRADMRRTDSAMQFDNWLVRKFAGDGRSADIVRVDRKLIWNLYPAKQSYRECALTGCASPYKPEPSKDKDKPQQTEKEPSCPLSVRKNELKVVASGEKKAINGFNTERYAMNWVVEVQDNQKRTSRNTVSLDLWTTPESGPVRDVQKIEQVYAQRLAAALKQGDHPFNRYLPREVMGSLGALMRGNSKIAGNWAGDMKKIKGYPILTTLTWNAEGNACQDDSASRSTAASDTPPTSLGGLLGSTVGSAVEKKATEATTTGALLSFTHEVKSMIVRPVSDSAFVPPVAYKKEP